MQKGGLGYGTVKLMETYDEAIVALSVITGREYVTADLSVDDLESLDAWAPALSINEYCVLKSALLKFLAVYARVRFGQSPEDVR